jgi:hypothetical protein
VRRSRLVAAGIVVVLVGGVAFARRLQQRGPDRPSVSGAVDRFRTSSTVATSTRLWEPRAGVYVYSGTGAESLSFLGTHQAQGPTEPGTVTLRPNGCWQFRIDYNSFHSQTWDRCSTRTQLVEAGGTADQRFDFVAFKTSEHSVTVCTPPFVVADLSAASGTSAPVHCVSRSQTTKSTSTQTGTATYVGRDTVTVGTARVPALHTRQDLRLSGGQTGEVHIDIWFAAANGLPLKESHAINVVSGAPAPINHVTYTELGSWHLTSLTPRA